MKGLSSLLALAAISSLFGDQQSPEQKYNELKTRAREGNMNFILATFGKLTDGLPHEIFTIRKLVVNFLVLGKDANSNFNDLEGEDREMVLIELHNEFKGCISQLCELGVFNKTGDGFLLNDHGKGMIAGLNRGMELNGDLTFGLLKKMSTEKHTSNGEVCEDCGQVHDENFNPLDAISEMFRKKRRQHGEDSIEELIAKLMRG